MKKKQKQSAAILIANNKEKKAERLRQEKREWYQRNKDNVKLKKGKQIENINFDNGIKETREKQTEYISSNNKMKEKKEKHIENINSTVNLTNTETEAALRKRKQREKEDKIKLKNKEKKQRQRIREKSEKSRLNQKKKLKKEKQKRWREKRRKGILYQVIMSNETISETCFSNRMNKSRALRKFKDSLPETPPRRAATIAAYLKNTKSPTVQILQKSNYIPSSEEMNESKMGSAVIEDLKATIQSTKFKRTNEARAAVNLLTASVSGESLTKSRAKVSLAKTLGVPVRRISKGTVIRSRILHSDGGSYLYTKRKTRCDSLTEETRKLIYDFWCQPENSHPTGNKNDMKRVRTGPKQYISHPVQILEKTQTELYSEFIESHANINISQRTFERCKPYFIRSARPKDRITCCCRYHLELKNVFKSCMDFRKKLNKTREPNDHLQLFNNMYDMCNETLCQQSSGFYEKSCLDRVCDKCGIKNCKFYSEELDTSSESPNVKWKCFEYININTKFGEKRKLMLVNKESKPGTMIEYLIKLLEKFPAHNFRAKWQNAQLKHLVQNLPFGHSITVHDFSENYRCKEQTEIQSDYFQKQEVSIHVSLLYRHAISEIDGEESTVENSKVVTEHFYVISDDEKHDHHFVNFAQSQISEYLKSISCKVKIMHEFCDGCACQYKSRHCLGDLASSVKHLGYSIITRNFFETSHAKGPQDAAGGLLKNQADLAVIRGKESIQSARDLFRFAVKNLTVPKSTGCKRRIFRYIEEIPRDIPRQYKPIPGIRSIHQAVVFDSKEINLRPLSCYKCENCLFYTNLQCENEHLLGTFVVHKIKRDRHSDDISLCDENGENICISEFIHKNSIFAVLCDDPVNDYYLVKANSDCYKLDQNMTDGWGVTYNRGTDVIEGNYFEKHNNNLLTYHLIRNKTALVPSSSVLYICDDVISRNGIVKLEEEVHQTVLECVKLSDYVR